jgi:hypothetical protein
MLFFGSIIISYGDVLSSEDVYRLEAVTFASEGTESRLASDLPACDWCELISVHGCIALDFGKGGRE